MFANKNNKQLLYFSVISVFLTISAFSSGFFLHKYMTNGENDLTILHESYRILQEHALFEIPPEMELEYGMIRGMLQTYDDPYTIFLEPPQHELQTNQLEGKFGGIGARLERDNQNNLLLYPFPDSPALKAGIIEGDHLIAVDDLTISPEMSMEDIQAAIRGPVNKKVTLIIARTPSFTPQTFSIKREEVS
ncbi:MAG: PDZ domain-containing protein, partial [Anaerolineaceae bacterium]|nr:PDZ domain-containing protein [Anaerolineaceae bacterium]